MSILKTYARLYADSVEQSLPLLQQLTGSDEPDFRFTDGEVQLVGIGDFLLFAGPPEERARHMHGSATVVVADLDDLTETLLAAGAVITEAATPAPTGRYLYARHAGGPEVEYVEWTPELVRRVVPR
ncbi:glyoxalase/bleomycin resistance/dioxygenase family protein [Streptomyces alboflavus]|uniref:glyoxalase/bleomycin resistance/dioxygenase family protein n=1 Tax=Streptomyces alboflavus TaxID=67267 RepID=UPI0004BFC281|nr:glyoxalase/bleomycin resistance/dioxygenase family protein [Streptomyces alboflavus]